MNIRLRIFRELKKLEHENFQDFKFHLRDYKTDTGKEFQSIPACDLENADRRSMADLIYQTYTNQALVVTCQVFQEIGRNDVKESLSQSSRSKTSLLPFTKLPTVSSVTQDVLLETIHTRRDPNLSCGSLTLSDDDWPALSQACSSPHTRKSFRSVKRKRWRCINDTWPPPRLVTRYTVAGR